MRCPNCGVEMKNPVCVKGGQVKCRKGYADPKLQARAIAIKRENKRMRSRIN